MVGFSVESRSGDKGGPRVPVPCGSEHVLRRTHLGQVRPPLPPAPDEPICLRFRHTFGSHLAQNGVSLYKISTLMGNSPEIWRRHYAALSTEDLAVDLDFPTDSTRVPRQFHPSEPSAVALRAMADKPVRCPRGGG